MSFTCQECGESFHSLNELGTHSRSKGHKGKPKKNIFEELKEVGQSKNSTSRTMNLTPEDLDEIREAEKANRLLEVEAKKVELEVRKAKAMSELNHYGNSSLHKFSLPDGTIVEATPKDFRELLEVYYLQNSRKRQDSDGESQVVQLLREEVRQLRESEQTKWRSDMESRISYLNSKDSIAEAEQGYARLMDFAKSRGMVQQQLSAKDQIRNNASDTLMHGVKNGIDGLSKRLDRQDKQRQEWANLAREELKKHPELLEKAFPSLRGSHSNNLNGQIPEGALEERMSTEQIERLNAQLDDNGDIVSEIGDPMTDSEQEDDDEQVNSPGMGSKGFPSAEPIEQKESEGIDAIARKVKKKGSKKGR